MKTLKDLHQALDWLKRQDCKGLATDSRNVVAQTVFIAWPGAATDGRVFVQAALDQGACGCLVEAHGLDAFRDQAWYGDARVVALPGLKAQTAPIAASFYGHPGNSLSIVAFTGTNGKTSSAWWMASLMQHLQGDTPTRCAVVGTLGIGEPPHLVPNGLTTPDPVLLQFELARLRAQGFSHCAMEASSIGIEEHRLDSTPVRVAVFTNFTQDHLDYHGNLQAYWQAKRALFNWPGLAHAVINLDDPKGPELARELETKGLDLWTIALNRPARLAAHNIVSSTQGMTFDLVETLPESRDVQSITCPVVGMFNVSNLLGVLAALRAQGFDLASVARACAHLLAVPGRMELIRQTGQATVVVDYAHTPDALEKALAALRPAVQSTGGRLWCVFGCGGNRDASKRPLMAKAVEQGADVIVVTSDNPRDEEPLAIMADIDKGFADATSRRLIPDRTLAIQTAIAAAQAQDVVLVAGKGHEPYQEIKGKRLPYSDIGTVQVALQHNGPMMLRTGQIAQALGATELRGDPLVVLRQVRTDTRAIQPGDLFVALKGDTFDGHDFVHAAAQKGAVAALVSTPQSLCDIPQIVVQDTRLALGALAKYWRAQFAIPVIGVTGSNGKTTVTQMIASILRRVYGDRALSTQGNLNNDIGLPLSLLQLQARHEKAVFELGMNHPGEIAYLADLAAPTVALVNNAQREHLEFMHTVENVARENGTCLTALPSTGTAVFPADEPYTGVWQSLAGPRPSLRFAMQAPADVWVSQLHWQDGHWNVQAMTPQGACEFNLSVAGRHNVKNALAALCCALAVGLSPKDAAAGLSAFEPVKGRSRSFSIMWGGRPLSVVDDTYNANPDSMKAAVDVLSELPAPRLLVVGDMGEVGDQGPQFHAELGAYAKSKGIDHLMCTGALSLSTARAFNGSHHFPDMAALISAVGEKAHQVASVLVKGSRFMKMEQVIAALQAGASDRKDFHHAA